MGKSSIKKKLSDEKRALHCIYNIKFYNTFYFHRFYIITKHYISNSRICMLKLLKLHVSFTYAQPHCADNISSILKKTFQL